MQRCIEGRMKFDEKKFRNCRAATKCGLMPFMGRKFVPVILHIDKVFQYDHEAGISKSGSRDSRRHFYDSILSSSVSAG